jgi:hypothetical protein
MSHVATEETRFVISHLLWGFVTIVAVVIIIRIIVPVRGCG